MDVTARSYFTKHLLDWYDPDRRPLPWKGLRDPYKIWLSEIILQQTRVEQGLPYYNRFVERYPSISLLAKAPEEEILKMWEGLGYYSRARNMQAAAHYIVEKLNGVFPTTYQEILALKGVGPYTAAAIASFAYQLPYAVVDGNVFRVLARFFGLVTPTDTTKGKKTFAQLAQQLLDQKAPDLYNQAIMDFGATICTPKNPSCKRCPLQARCYAFHENSIELLPVKSKKLKKKNRYFHFLVIRSEGQILLQQRTDKDVWQGLFQFPLIELPQPLPQLQSLYVSPLWKKLSLEKITIEIQSGGFFRQTLSHQHIHADFFEIRISQMPHPLPAGYFWVPSSSIRDYAFPKVIDWYLSDNSLYLNLR